MQQHPAPAGTVSATLEYLLPTTERPFNYMYAPPEGKAWHNASYERTTVTIRDARSVRDDLSIDRDGFELHDAPTAVRDFYDRDEIVEVYYPEIAQLALAATGASHVFVFDHLLRKRESGVPRAFGRRDGHRPGAAGRVHADFTVASARRRLEAELNTTPIDAVSRYSILNLWRAIRHPVLDAPLAVCDARTVAPGDLVACDIFYPERNGEIYEVVHQPRHEWSYFPSMTRDEVLIFKQFDSAGNQVASVTPHAAFEHPDAPADTPPRESIEIRCLLVFDI
jgi:hypothetical protein